MGFTLARDVLPCCFPRGLDEGSVLALERRHHGAAVTDSSPPLGAPTYRPT
jgi:hypothetical protein